MQLCNKIDLKLILANDSKRAWTKYDRRAGWESKVGGINCVGGD